MGFCVVSPSENIMVTQSHPDMSLRLFYRFVNISFSNQGHPTLTIITNTKYKTFGKYRDVVLEANYTQATCMPFIHCNGRQAKC